MRPILLTPNGWFPRTMVMILLFSENHCHAPKNILVLASVFGIICSLQTVDTGPAIYL